jgi:molybdopterin synthase catalytic subunit
MAISIWEASITTDPLEYPGRTADSDSGAVVDFWGTVREMENGREIVGINYEAHQTMAHHQMNLLAEKATVDFFLTQLVLRHRIGFVRTGEASLFLRVASRHRAAAFAASQWLIGELKQKVPIWKRVVFRDTKQNEVAEITKQFEEATRA